MVAVMAAVVGWRRRWGGGVAVAVAVAAVVGWWRRRRTPRRLDQHLLRDVLDERVEDRRQLDGSDVLLLGVRGRLQRNRCVLELAVGWRKAEAKRERERESE